ncbi:cytochrome-c peroxidase [Maribacter sp. 2304DJ31-5]|uniref:cytochrome-c peroxidase n=1 Tax=Maribacter sp. 2304DJ31-5 TaxID=3386273 RepID=UPI0039BC3855
MACVSCHAPEKAYADEFVVNKDNSGNPLQRNTPTLINTIFQKNFFWDGRSPTLSDQISSVFTNEKEFDTNVHQFSSRILKDAVYEELFEEVFGKIKLKNTHVIKAISAYVGTLNGFDSKFDKNMRGGRKHFYQRRKARNELVYGEGLMRYLPFYAIDQWNRSLFIQKQRKRSLEYPIQEKIKYWMIIWVSIGGLKKSCTGACSRPRL